jgi:hypothetical protein
VFVEAILCLVESTAALRQTTFRRGLLEIELALEIVTQGWFFF